MCKICQSSTPENYQSIPDGSKKGCLNGKSCCRLCPKKWSLSCALHVILITTASFCTVTAIIAPYYQLALKVSGALAATVGEVCNCYWTRKFAEVGEEI